MMQKKLMHISSSNVQNVNQFPDNIGLSRAYNESGTGIPMRYHNGLRRAELSRSVEEYP